MPKFCPTCGKPLQFENAEICPSCGVRISTQSVQIKGEKSSGTAALLSFFFTGLGQVYNGDFKRGVLFLIGTYVGLLFFIIPGVIVWGYQIYDAYSTAKKMSAGEIPIKEANTTEMILYVVLVFVAIIILIIIAAVFSYIVLGSGFFTTQQAQQTVYKGVEQSTANIQMIGNVYGLASNPSAGIDEIRFSIGLAPGAPEIDLTKMKIVFSTPTNSPIILTHGSTSSRSVFVTKNGAGNVINSMNANEQVEISFKTAPVTANTVMNIELRPAVGAALPFRKTAPQTILKTNVLY